MASLSPSQACSVRLKRGMQRTKEAKVGGEDAEAFVTGIKVVALMTLAARPSHRC